MDCNSQVCMYKYEITRSLSPKKETQPRSYLAVDSQCVKGLLGNLRTILRLCKCIFAIPIAAVTAAAARWWCILPDTC